MLKISAIVTIRYCLRSPFARFPSENLARVMLREDEYYESPSLWYCTSRGKMRTTLISRKVIINLWMNSR